MLLIKSKGFISLLYNFSSLYLQYANKEIRIHLWHEPNPKCIFSRLLQVHWFIFN
ncbi:Uncharacterised protein [Actinobacillus pleuropneumoniae]|nr:Uncharacterised protein [Actinobacillus pleuropneumoniae]